MMKMPGLIPAIVRSPFEVLLEDAFKIGLRRQNWPADTGLNTRRHANVKIAAIWNSNGVPGSFRCSPRHDETQ